MTARDRILTAVRSGLSAPRPSPDIIATEAASLLETLDAARPRLSAPTLIEAFECKATALGTTVDRVSGMAGIPHAVRRYLEGHGLPLSLSLQPSAELAALDWTGFDTHARIAPDEMAALGVAVWGIAESGSLAVHSGADTPILLSFLPLHHIVVLREATLLAHLEDYAARLAQTEPPRNAILITGPSGTTDIEGSYVRGAHGPGFLHVIVVAVNEAVSSKERTPQ